ncbi:hypothetical protein FA13DRAFT_1725118 [Coprinellus micaceus]|uniref:Uncharacterized protein n=1 Tax=Coprinellus micaceus TaxID=71717 RepID=A0A4Y7TYB4_COPMI|nr:hypothetical protein FA13DRAFT_1725118 [Coprinellus micaceus]
MSSTHTYGSTARASRIYGVPHAPHNQIQIILPTPLASANNSRESLAMTRARFGPDAFDRRSIADPWMSTVIHRSFVQRGSLTSDLFFSVTCGACLGQCTVQILLVFTANAGSRERERVSKGTN